jgi:hypothetical protein
MMKPEHDQPPISQLAAYEMDLLKFWCFALSSMATLAYCAWSQKLDET